MSTPYVGLKHLSKSPVPGILGMESPWKPKGADDTPAKASVQSDAWDVPTRLEAKEKLIAFMSETLGVESVQVGACWMRLGPAVPERHLLNAGQALLKELQGEPGQSAYHALALSRLMDDLMFQPASL